MGEEEANNTEETVPPPAVPPAAPAVETEASKDAAEEKSVIPLLPADEKPKDSKALALVDKPAPEGKAFEGSLDREAVLSRVETEKRMCLIKAWEESEKVRAENKAYKKMSAITAWENTKKASTEAELKKIEQELEMKKAEYAVKLKNKIAMIHRTAEEKRAMTEAKRGEDIIKTEELAAKFRSTNQAPKKIFSFLRY